MSYEIRFCAWPSWAKNCGLYLAEDLGKFRKLDLSVTVVDSPSNILSALLHGETDIAEVSCTMAIRAIRAGMPYRIIAIREAICPYGTLSLTRNPIASPQDYVGKSWGHTKAFSEDVIVLPRLAEVVGFDNSRVTMKECLYVDQLSAVFEGEVDFISASWGSDYPEQITRAGNRASELKYIRWSDYGLAVYADCFVATTTWLQRYGELATKFFAGLREGVLAGFDDPELGIHSIVSHESKLTVNRNLLTLAVNQSLDVLLPPQTEAHKLFHIVPAVLLNTARAACSDWEGESVTELYSNEYLS